uniref:Mantle protein 12 n=1 Tax=Pinctada fucata TaxID=50426 RepID=Q45TJ8_PINFU|nr:mantle protein 12 [Pinctada fucata]
MKSLSILAIVNGLLMISYVQALPETCPETEGIITDCREAPPNPGQCKTDADCQDDNKRCCSYGCGGRTACFTKKKDSELPTCWQSMNVGSECPYWVYSQTRWYYDKPSRRCLSFMYTGCGGNQNNFVTYLSCMQECMMKYVPGGPTISNPWEPPTIHV